MTEDVNNFRKRKQREREAAIKAIKQLLLLITVHLVIIVQLQVKTAAITSKIASECVTKLDLHCFIFSLSK